MKEKEKRRRRKLSWPSLIKEPIADILLPKEITEYWSEIFSGGKSSETAPLKLNWKLVMEILTQ